MPITTDRQYADRQSTERERMIGFRHLWARQRGYDHVHFLVCYKSAQIIRRGDLSHNLHVALLRDRQLHEVSHQSFLFGEHDADRSIRGPQPGHAERLRLLLSQMHGSEDSKRIERWV